MMALCRRFLMQGYLLTTSQAIQDQSGRDCRSPSNTDDSF
jgi:hypothetical protein